MVSQDCRLQVYGPTLSQKMGSFLIPKFSNLLPPAREYAQQLTDSGQPTAGDVVMELATMRQQRLRCIKASLDEALLKFNLDLHHNAIQMIFNSHLTPRYCPPQAPQPPARMGVVECWLLGLFIILIGVLMVTVVTKFLTQIMKKRKGGGGREAAQETEEVDPIINGFDKLLLDMDTLREKMIASTRELDQANAELLATNAELAAAKADGAAAAEAAKAEIEAEKVAAKAAGDKSYTEGYIKGYTSGGNTSNFGLQQPPAVQDQQLAVKNGHLPMSFTAAAEVAQFAPRVRKHHHRKRGGNGEIGGTLINSSDLDINQWLQ